jgi:hypothetical protein
MTSEETTPPMLPAHMKLIMMCKGIQSQVTVSLPPLFKPTR